MDRYYYKDGRIYDRSEMCGTEHICIAANVEKWRAKIIVREMNQGLPYRPDISYKERD